MNQYEIYYMKPNYIAHFILGIELPKVEQLHQTHIKLKSVTVVV